MQTRWSVHPTSWESRTTTAVWSSCRKWQHQTHKSSVNSSLMWSRTLSSTAVQWVRSFSYAVPAIWNTLPYEIRSSNTMSSFKSSPKTDLFQQSYWLWLCGWVGEGAGRERVRGRESERTSGLSQSVRVFSTYFVSCNGSCTLKEKWLRKEYIVILLTVHLAYPSVSRGWFWC